MQGEEGPEDDNLTLSKEQRDPTGHGNTENAQRTLPVDSRHYPSTTSVQHMEDD